MQKYPWEQESFDNGSRPCEQPLADTDSCDEDLSCDEDGDGPLCAEHAHFAKRRKLSSVKVKGKAVVSSIAITTSSSLQPAVSASSGSCSSLVVAVSGDDCLHSPVDGYSSDACVECKHCGASISKLDCGSQQLAQVMFGVVPDSVSDSNDAGLPGGHLSGPHPTKTRGRPPPPDDVLDMERAPEHWSNKDKRGWRKLKADRQKFRDSQMRRRMKVEAKKWQRLGDAVVAADCDDCGKQQEEDGDSMPELVNDSDDTNIDDKRQVADGSYQHKEEELEEEVEEDYGHCNNCPSCKQRMAESYERSQKSTVVFDSKSKAKRSKSKSRACKSPRIIAKQSLPRGDVKLKPEKTDATAAALKKKSKSEEEFAANLAAAFGTEKKEVSKMSAAALRKEKKRAALIPKRCLPPTVVRMTAETVSLSFEAPNCGAVFCTGFEIDIRMVRIVFANGKKKKVKKKKKKKSDSLESSSKSKKSCVSDGSGIRVWADEIDSDENGSSNERVEAGEWQLAYRNTDGQSGVYKVPGLWPHCIYQVRVRGRNKHGWGAFSESLRFSTPSLKKSTLRFEEFERMFSAILRIAGGNNDDSADAEAMHSDDAVDYGCLEWRVKDNETIAAEYEALQRQREELSAIRKKEERRKAKAKEKKRQKEKKKQMQSRKASKAAKAKAKKKKKRERKQRLAAMGGANGKGKAGVSALTDAQLLADNCSDEDFDDYVYDDWEAHSEGEESGSGSAVKGLWPKGGGDDDADEKVEDTTVRAAVRRRGAKDWNEDCVKTSEDRAADSRSPSVSVSAASGKSKSKTAPRVGEGEDGVGARKKRQGEMSVEMSAEMAPTSKFTESLRRAAARERRQYGGLRPLDTSSRAVAGGSAQGYERSAAFGKEQTRRRHPDVSRLARELEEMMRTQIDDDSHYRTGAYRRKAPTTGTGKAQMSYRTEDCGQRRVLPPTSEKRAPDYYYGDDAVSSGRGPEKASSKKRYCDDGRDDGYYDYYCATEHKKSAADSGGHSHCPRIGGYQEAGSGRRERYYSPAPRYSSSPRVAAVCQRHSQAPARGRHDAYEYGTGAPRHVRYLTPGSCSPVPRTLPTVGTGIGSAEHCRERDAASGSVQRPEPVSKAKKLLSDLAYWDQVADSLPPTVRVAANPTAAAFADGDFALTSQLYRLEKKAKMAPLKVRGHEKQKEDIQKEKEKAIMTLAKPEASSPLSSSESHQSKMSGLLPSTTSSGRVASSGYDERLAHGTRSEQRTEYPREGYRPEPRRIREERTSASGFPQYPERADSDSYASYRRAPRKAEIADHRYDGRREPVSEVRFAEDVRREEVRREAVAGHYYASGSGSRLPPPPSRERREVESVYSTGRQPSAPLSSSVASYRQSPRECYGTHVTAVRGSEHQYRRSEASVPHSAAASEPRYFEQQSHGECLPFRIEDESYFEPRREAQFDASRLLPPAARPSHGAYEDAHCYPPPQQLHSSAFDKYADSKSKEMHPSPYRRSESSRIQSPHCVEAEPVKMSDRFVASGERYAEDRQREYERRRAVESRKGYPESARSDPQFGRRPEHEMASVRSRASMPVSRRSEPVKMPRKSRQDFRVREKGGEKIRMPLQHQFERQKGTLCDVRPVNGSVPMSECSALRQPFVPSSDIPLPTFLWVTARGSYSGYKPLGKLVFAKDSKEDAKECEPKTAESLTAFKGFREGEHVLRKGRLAQILAIDSKTHSVTVKMLDTGNIVESEFGFLQKESKVKKEPITKLKSGECADDSEENSVGYETEDGSEYDSDSESVSVSVSKTHYTTPGQ